MAPKNTVGNWGMHVLFRVRVSVVAAMMSSPPQRTALGGTTGNKGSNELNDPVSLKCPVRKIAVVKSGDRKHPCRIRNKADEKTRPNEWVKKR